MNVRFSSKDDQLLAQENAALRQKVTTLEEQLAHLQEQFDWLRKQVFGRKTEQTSVIMDGCTQLALLPFENEQAVSVWEKTVTVPKHQRKAKRTHDDRMQDLPIEVKWHTEEHPVCEKCGAEMKEIGEDKAYDELVYVPGKFFVRRHIVKKYKCTKCGQDPARDAEYPDEIERCNIRSAAYPKPMIPHSFCSPELLAHIIYEKFAKAVPLYRQEKDFASKGIPLLRVTMSNWVCIAAEQCCMPIIEEMIKRLVAGSVIHADETVLQVLHEDGRLILNTKLNLFHRRSIRFVGEIDADDNVLIVNDDAVHDCGKQCLEILGLCLLDNERQCHTEVIIGQLRRCGRDGVDGFSELLPACFQLLDGSIQIVELNTIHDCLHNVLDFLLDVCKLMLQQLAVRCRCLLLLVGSIGSSRQLVKLLIGQVLTERRAYSLVQLIGTKPVATVILVALVVMILSVSHARTDNRCATRCADHPAGQHIIIIRLVLASTMNRFRLDLLHHVKYLLVNQSRAFIHAVLPQGDAGRSQDDGRHGQEAFRVRVHHARGSADGQAQPRLHPHLRGGLPGFRI